MEEVKKMDSMFDEKIDVVDTVKPKKSKLQLASLIINLAGIVVYALITIFLVICLIDAKIKSNNLADGETDLNGLVMIIVIVYGAIFYLISLVINLISMILALIGKHRKKSRVAVSVLFVILPIITYILLLVIGFIMFNQA